MSISNNINNIEDQFLFLVYISATNYNRHAYSKGLELVTSDLLLRAARSFLSHSVCWTLPHSAHSRLNILSEDIVSIIEANDSGRIKLIVLFWSIVLLLQWWIIADICLQASEYLHLCSSYVTHFNQLTKTY